MYHISIGIVTPEMLKNVSYNLITHAKMCHSEQEGHLKLIVLIYSFLRIYYKFFKVHSFLSVLIFLDYRINDTVCIHKVQLQNPHFTQQKQSDLTKYNYTTKRELENDECIVVIFTEWYSVTGRCYTVILCNL